MKIKFNKRYAAIAMYAFFVIIFTICFALVCYYFRDIAAFFSSTLDGLKAIVYALIFTLILLPLVSFIERFLKKHILKSEKNSGTANALSVIISVIILIAVIALLMLMILPSLITTASDLYEVIKNSIEPIMAWIEQNIQGNENLLPVYERLEEDLISRFNEIEPLIINSAASYITKAVNQVFAIVIGLIISIYMLISRKKVTAILSKLTSAIFPVGAASSIKKFVKRLYVYSAEFLFARLLSSLIIILITMLSLYLMGSPYFSIYGLLSFAGVMIPVIGPIFTTIIAAAIALIVHPEIWLYVVATFISLYALNYFLFTPLFLRAKLRPKIGLSLAVTLIAFAIGKIPGVIFAIPVFATIEYSVREFSAKILIKKKLPTKYQEFCDINEISPVENIIESTVLDEGEFGEEIVIFDSTDIDTSIAEVTEEMPRDTSSAPDAQDTTDKDPVIKKISGKLVSFKNSIVSFIKKPGRKDVRKDDGEDEKKNK